MLLITLGNYLEDVLPNKLLEQLFQSFLMCSASPEKKPENCLMEANPYKQKTCLFKKNDERNY